MMLPECGGLLGEGCDSSGFRSALEYERIWCLLPILQVQMSNPVVQLFEFLRVLEGIPTRLPALQTLSPCTSPPAPPPHHLYPSAFPLNTCRLQDRDSDRLWGFSLVLRSASARYWATENAPDKRSWSALHLFRSDDSTRITGIHKRVFNGFFFCEISSDIHLPNVVQSVFFLVRKQCSARYISTALPLTGRARNHPSHSGALRALHNTSSIYREGPNSRRYSSNRVKLGARNNENPKSGVEE